MGLEIIIFVIAITFGVILYWRESNNNKTYKFFNKLVNSKALQMHPNDPKGFVYKQSFVSRLLFLALFSVIAALVVQFVTPISIFTTYYGISSLASFTFGAVLGTYLSNFIIKSSQIAHDKSEDIGEFLDDAVNTGKTVFKGINKKDKTQDNEPLDRPPKDQSPTRLKDESDEQSARDRLKDKGLM